MMPMKAMTIKRDPMLKVRKYMLGSKMENRKNDKNWFLLIYQYNTNTIPILEFFKKKVKEALKLAVVVWYVLKEETSEENH